MKLLTIACSTSAHQHISTSAHQHISTSAWRTRKMEMTRSSALSRYLPISFFQKVMIDAALDPETTALYHQNLTIRWGFWITPGISERSIRRAFDKLVERHESLRLRFCQNGKEWVAEVLDKHPSGLLVTDLGHLSKEEQVVEVGLRANAPMTAFSNPMFEMHLIKCGGDGDVIIIRGHHAIMDGYSVIVLTEELIRLALNMPLLYGSGSHREFIEVSESRAQYPRSLNDQFWEQALLPAPKPLNIGRVTRGMPEISRRQNGLSHVLTNVFSEAESKKLEIFAKHIGVTPFSVVYAAFCEALRDITGQNEVIICTIVGRQDAKLMNFIGSDTELIAQKYVSNTSSLDKKARDVFKANQNVVQYLPSDMLLPSSRLAKSLSQEGVTLWRFSVQNTFPSGRISKSPFSKLFQLGFNQKISLGFIKVERLSFETPRDSIFELTVKFNNLPSGPNVTIVGDVEAYEIDQLWKIARLMAAKF